MHIMCLYFLVIQIILVQQIVSGSPSEKCIPLAQSRWTAILKHCDNSGENLLKKYIVCIFENVNKKDVKY